MDAVGTSVALNGILASVRLLTTREREVAGLIASEMANKEIASELQVSLSTVKHHVNAVLRKLQLSSRREVVAVWAVHAQNGHGGRRPGKAAVTLSRTRARSAGPETDRSGS
jgi:DNA-binding CsgD family transcriptional regulator